MTQNLAGNTLQYQERSGVLEGFPVLRNLSRQLIILGPCMSTPRPATPSRWFKLRSLLPLGFRPGFVSDLLAVSSAFGLAAAAFRTPAPSCCSYHQGSCNTSNYWSLRLVCQSSHPPATFLKGYICFLVLLLEGSRHSELGLE